MYNQGWTKSEWREPAALNPSEDRSFEVPVGAVHAVEPSGSVALCETKVRDSGRRWSQNVRERCPMCVERVKSRASDPGG